MNSKTGISLKLPDWYSHRKLKELLRKPQKEDIPAVIAGIAIIAVISYLFYHSFWAYGILSPLIVPFVDKMRKERNIKRNHEIGQQFKDVLVSVSTSQKAGYALENAFVVAYKDMKKLYGEHNTQTFDMEVEFSSDGSKKIYTVLATTIRNKTE